MTTKTVNVQQMTDELKAIRADLNYIKEHMVDVDTIMTSEEEKRFEESMKEYKEGKTTSLADMKKELGL